MPDQEVLINESNLNAIANAIRRKNGLVRTYKPREMAPAIKQIGASAPDSRGYTVTVRQSPHQHITVKQFLGGEKQYDQSFTVSEPYWKVQATIEADAGYVAGVLNHAEEITLDRDITISASPAYQNPVPPDVVNNLYWWSTYRGVGSPGYYSSLSWDIDEYVKYENNNNYQQFRPFNQNVYNISVSNNLDQLPWALLCLLSIHDYGSQYAPDATDVLINLQGKRGMVQIGESVVSDMGYLETLQLSNWNVTDVERIYYPFTKNISSNLKLVSGMSDWNLENCISLEGFIESGKYFTGLDLSNWNTPKLERATDLFRGDYARILDISNWDTTKIGSFSTGIRPRTIQGTTYPAYLIMDKDEVKFSGNYIFNNIANCKYLVPESRVQDYKQHPNWQSRASQIDSVTNYTINRGNGQVEVVPNW